MKQVLFIKMSKTATNADRIEHSDSYLNFAGKVHENNIYISTNDY